MNIRNNDVDLERTIELVRSEIGRYADYHKHKETAAYTGLALFTGATGLVLTSDRWPPPVWGTSPECISVIALTVFWFAVLYFLRFQLHNRRWAALRVAGCERVLVRWATNNLNLERLGAATRPPLQSNRIKQFLINLVDWFWPLKKSVPVMEESEIPYYPGVLIDAWVEVENGKGTKAIRHERLLIISGWVLYACMLYRTLCL